MSKSFMMRTVLNYMPLMIIVCMHMACGSQLPRGDLLSELRVKNQRLTGESETPGIKPKTKSSSSSTLAQQDPAIADDYELFISPQKLFKLYPPQRYISAAGYANQKNLNRAILDAKKTIAQDISSAIISRSVVFQQAESQTKNGRKTIKSTTKEMLESEQLSRFDRAELIKINAELTRCNETQCVAVAYLDRTQLARDYQRSYQPLENRFNVLYRQMNQLDASSLEQISTFAEQWHHLNKIYNDLRPVAQLLEVILADRFTGFDQVHQAYMTLDSKRMKLVSQAPVIIQMNPLKSKELTNPVYQTLKKALVSMGLKTKYSKGDQQKCQHTQGKSFLFKVDGMETEKNFFGVQRHLVLSVDLQSCPSEEPIDNFRLPKIIFSVPNNKTLAEYSKIRLKFLHSKIANSLYESLKLHIPVLSPQQLKIKKTF